MRLGDLAHRERVVHHHDERRARRWLGARARRLGCGAARRRAPAPASAAAPSRCTSCTGFRISTTWPLPSTVAPDDAGKARELRADGLHHDLAVADDLVHADRGALHAALQQQHRDLARRRRRVDLAQQRQQRAQRIAVVLPRDLALRERAPRRAAPCIPAPARSSPTASRRSSCPRAPSPPASPRA